RMLFFFFQAEDGIRDFHVTGVQTCALPILLNVDDVSGSIGKLDYPTDLTNATGNVVYIEHADGSIGTYCHLKENSIIVREGDVVNKGQELGKLGNSGNSFAPHLHLHVLDNPNGKKLTEYSDGLFMESLPYSFAAFVKLGALPVDYLTQEPIVPFVPTMERDCRDMLPA